MGMRCHGRVDLSSPSLVLPVLRFYYKAGKESGRWGSISFLRFVVVITAGAHKQRDTTGLIMNNVLINYL